MLTSSTSDHSVSGAASLAVLCTAVVLHAAARVSTGGGLSEACATAMLVQAAGRGLYKRAAARTSTLVSGMSSETLLAA